MFIYEGKTCPPPEGYIAIVVAKFNRSITQNLLDGALETLRQHKVREQDLRVAWVPGAFELPIVADYFVQDDECLAVICLGAVIKGETSHDQHINRAVSTELARMNVESGVPVIFGLLTCDTLEQAIARSGGDRSSRDKGLGGAVGNKGAEAAEAALEMIDLLEELPSNGDNSPLGMLSDMMARRFGMYDDDDDDDNDDDEDDDYIVEFEPLSKPRKKTVKKAVKRAVKKTCKKKACKKTMKKPPKKKS